MPKQTLYLKKENEACNLKSKQDTTAFSFQQSINMGSKRYIFDQQKSLEMNEKPDLICGSVMDCNSITQLKIKLIYIFGPIKSE